MRLVNHELLIAALLLHALLHLTAAVHWHNTASIYCEHAPFTAHDDHTGKEPPAVFTPVPTGILTVAAEFSLPAWSGTEAAFFLPDRQFVRPPERAPPSFV